MMRNTTAFLLILLFALEATAIPWPLGDGTTGWESIFPVMRTYGNYDENAYWAAVDQYFTGHTFHNAIDISQAQALTENVRVVEDGLFTFVSEAPPGSGQWCAQIFPSGSSYGWHYGHLQNDGSIPFDSVQTGTTPVSYGDFLCTMAEIGSGKHLHFFRTDQLTYSDGNPGVDDPLDYIDPAYASVPANGYTWEFENATTAVFFLPQRDAITGAGSWTIYYDPPEQQGDPVNTANVINDMIDANNLSGAIDVMYCVLVKGYPQGSSVESSGIPEQIEWTLYRTLKSEEDTLFTKYNVDFDGSIGAAPGDWQEFRRFYFPFFPNQLGFFGTGYKSKIVCLTNVIDDTPSYDGINNIDENCWQTDSDLSGTGTATVPSRALYPDGEYRIEITSYAHDASDHVISEDVVVANFQGYVESVTIVDAVTDQTYWDAYWETVETMDGYELQFVINTVEATFSTGQPLDIEIHFSESMNPNSSPTGPTIALQHEKGYPMPMSGNWSGTTVDNDTWTGTIPLSETVVPGRVTLLVSCQDLSEEWLMDPADPGEPCMDIYHGFDLAFGIEPGWPESVHDEVKGSPKLADIDLDGDLDVIIQSADGWVDVLDDDGSSMSGWPVSGNWSSGNPDVWASPAVVNLTGVSSSAPEILAVHPWGCNGFTATGSAISPWYGTLASTFRWNALCSPVAGNFNGAGDNEYVLGRQRAQGVINDISMLARENDGSGFWLKEWGSDESVSSTPSLCDADADGNLEVIAVSDYASYPADSYGTIYCLGNRK
ncbi:MAG: hypothetical protein KAR40_00855 [Candidatus Sabulitectum sp.]|nr:hypothetical protein [Candidatus Sabulitectum sp.]